MTIMLEAAEQVYPDQSRKPVQTPRTSPILVYLLALFIGSIVALDPVMALAAVSWMTFRADLDPTGNWLAFRSYRWMPRLFSLAALLELVADLLPSMPSRKGHHHE